MLGGGAVRELALLPWFGLALGAGGADLVLSVRRGQQVSFDMAPEIFIGEVQRLTFTAAGAAPPGGLSARLAWPEAGGGGGRVCVSGDPP